MRQDHLIAVVIPALNEAQAIGRVLDEIPTWVDDVIVADNGSCDATPDVAHQHGARVVFAHRRGYGSACQAGIAALDNPGVVVFLDGDHSDYPAQMDRLVEPIVTGRADLVIGSRVLGSCERGALTPQARFGNWLACRLMRLFWGAAHTDLGPFRAIRFTALQRLRMNDPDFGWTVEMQVKAAQWGLRVREAPVSYRHRIGVSKISRTLSGSVRAGMKILSVIFRSAFKEHLRRCSGAPPCRGRRGDRGGGQMRDSRPRRQSPTPSFGTGWGTLLKHALGPGPAVRVPVERLIVFTRFPEVGKVKTRLIPFLGQSGAADLHEKLTDHTLEWVRVLRNLRGVQVEIRFTGGDAERMCKRFGDDLDYISQGSGDLGERMGRAVRDAFDTGARSVVLVGTDCPALTADRAQSAFDQLQNHDLVIGPAADGGYYFLGQRRFVPALFTDVAWGTPSVLRETLCRAETARVSFSLLQELRDVDVPADLEAWDETAETRRQTHISKISVIIPTLNESASIDEALAALGETQDIERIVVDGSSTDDTVQRALMRSVRVLHGARGRAQQMNAGAAIASGDALVFLHADTRLGPAELEAIRQALSDPECVGGAFSPRIDSNRGAMRVISWGINVRSRFLHLPYGDQCIFVRTSVFRQLGGYRPMPIMEDTDLVHRLRKRGRFLILSECVLMTERHWQHGLVRTTLVNWMIAALFTMGVAPERLDRLRRCVLPKAIDALGIPNRGPTELAEVTVHCGFRIADCGQRAAGFSPSGRSNGRERSARSKDRAG